MKLSTAVLAASVVEADFPWSACYENGNPAICAKSCQSKLLWRAIKRDMYGSDSWIYKVMGTEKLDKAEAKASYRNVAHFDEKTCTTETLTTLYQALRRNQVLFDLLEKTEGMMRMEHAYANFEEAGPDANEYASDCGLGKRGLFVQFMRDSNVREDNAMDFMNGGKTKDWYYLQLQNLSNFDDAVDLDAVNACIKGAKLYRIKEEINGGAPNDLTKCIAYKACKKTPDWSNEATPPPTEAPTTEAPTEAPVPNCCDTITQENNVGDNIVWTKTAEINEGYPVYNSGDLSMWWMWHGPEGHWVVNKTPGAHGGDVVKSEFDLDMCPDQVANWQDGSTFQCGSPTVSTTLAPPATTGEPGDFLTPDPTLPDFNDLDYTFECVDSDEVANRYQKCTITTENGWVFHGREKDGVVDFQPVRYGVSPEGDNRWKAPIINYDYPEPTNGHLNERIMCRQGQAGQEDCLFMSIAVKKEYLKNKTKVPILYHIHGGGFTNGSGMNAQRNAANYQDVMIVGVNYRLGPWGFFYLNEKEADQEFQGNWGLLDQQAGLKWLHSFAGIFGGDKNRVTLTGGSAGSESCWRQFTIPSSWPYFHQMAPVGIGLLTGIKSPHKIERLSNAFFDEAGCSLNDMDCMRALADADILDIANKAGDSMRWDDVAMVLNGSFAPTHRSGLMPDTLFNMVKNRQVRPNTPFLWTYARDETYGMVSNWINSRAKTGQPLAPLKSEINAAIESSGFKNPSPYFDTWLTTVFGDDLGGEMIEQFGCGDAGTDCHEQIARFTVATQWVCSTRYALEGLYGPNNPNGVLYPVEFAEPNCGPSEEEKTHACHGADGGWVKASQFNKNDFGKFVGKAYGAFYTTGSIPQDKDYTLKSWEDMQYNDLNQISKSRWGQFGIRREDCAALDKLQEAFDWYNWGITNGDEDSMVENSQ